MNMISNINSLLDKNQSNRIKEYRDKLLNHKLIKEFIDEYRDVINEKMIDTGLSVFNEFYININDPKYQPELIIYSGQINIRYTIRDKTLEQRFRDKVPARILFDESTKKYKGVNLNDLTIDNNNAKLINYLKEFIEVYRYGDNSKGLWVFGEFGIGKSYALAGFANDLHMRDVGVTYISSSQLMDDLYQSIKMNSSSIEKKLNNLMKAECLIIDDIGTEKTTDFTIKRVIYPIIKYRGEHNKPTFVSSNLSKADYYNHILKNQEINKMDVARLKEQLDVLMQEFYLRGINRRVKA